MDSVSSGFYPTTISLIPQGQVYFSNDELNLKNDFNLLKKSLQAQFFSKLMQANIYSPTAEFLLASRFEEIKLPPLGIEECKRFKKDLLAKKILIKDRDGNFSFSFILSDLIKYLFSFEIIQDLEIKGSFLYYILGDEWLKSYFKALGYPEIYEKMSAEMRHELLKKPIDADLHFNAKGANDVQLKECIDGLLKFFMQACNSTMKEKQDQASILKGCFSKYGLINTGMNHGWMISFGGENHSEIDLGFIDDFYRSHIFDHDALTLKITRHMLFDLLREDHLTCNLVPEGKIAGGWASPPLRLAKVLHTANTNTIDLSGALTIYSYATKGYSCSSQALESAILKKSIHLLVSSQSDVAFHKLCKSLDSHLPKKAAFRAAFCFNLFTFLHRFKCDSSVRTPLAIALLKHSPSATHSCLEWMHRLLLRDANLFLLISAYLTVFSRMHDLQNKEKDAQKNHFSLFAPAHEDRPFAQLVFNFDKSSVSICLLYDFIEALKCIQELDPEGIRIPELKELSACFLNDFSECLDLEYLFKNCPFNEAEVPEIGAMGLKFLEMPALEQTGFFLLTLCSKPGYSSAYGVTLASRLVDLFLEEESALVRRNLLYYFFCAHRSLASLENKEMLNIQEGLDVESSSKSELLNLLCLSLKLIEDETLLLCLFKKWQSLSEKAKQMSPELAKSGKILMEKCLIGHPERSMKIMLILLRENCIHPDDCLQPFEKIKRHYRLLQGGKPEKLLLQLKVAADYMTENSTDFKAPCTDLQAAQRIVWMGEMIKDEEFYSFSVWAKIIPNLSTGQTGEMLDTLLKCLDRSQEQKGECWLYLLRKMVNEKSPLFVKLIDRLEEIKESVEFGPKGSIERSEAFYLLTIGCLQLLHLPEYRKEYFHPVFHAIEKSKEELFNHLTRKHSIEFLFFYVHSFFKTSSPDIFEKVMQSLENLTRLKLSDVRVMEFLNAAVQQYAQLKEDPNEKILKILLVIVMVHLKNPVEKGIFLPFFSSFLPKHVFQLTIQILKSCHETGKLPPKRDIPLLCEAICQRLKMLAVNTADIAIGHSLLSHPAMPMLFKPVELNRLWEETSFNLLSGAVANAGFLEINAALDCYQLPIKKIGTSVDFEEKMIPLLAKSLSKICFEDSSGLWFKVHFFNVVNSFVQKLAKGPLHDDFHYAQETVGKFYKEGKKTLYPYVHITVVPESVTTNKKAQAANKKRVIPAYVRGINDRGQNNLFRLLEIFLGNITENKIYEYSDQLLILTLFRQYFTLMIKYFPDQGEKLYTLVHKFAFRYTPSPVILVCNVNTLKFFLDWLDAQNVGKIKKSMHIETALFTHLDQYLTGKLNLEVNLEPSFDCLEMILNLVKSLVSSKNVLLAGEAIKVLNYNNEVLSDYPEKLKEGYKLVIDCMAECLHETDKLEPGVENPLKLFYIVLIQNKDFHLPPFKPGFQTAVGEIFELYFDAIPKMKMFLMNNRKKKDEEEKESSYLDALLDQVYEIWQLSSMESQERVRFSLINKLIPLAVDEVAKEKKVYMEDFFRELFLICQTEKEKENLLQVVTIWNDMIKLVAIEKLARDL